MKSLLKYGALLLALGLAITALSEHFAKLPGQLSQVNLQLLCLTAFGLVGYQILNASVWAEVLKALSLRVSHFQSARIWIESESMKWLPGAIWSYGSRIVSAPKLSLSKKQCSVSMALELILTNAAWATLACTVFFNRELIQLATPYLEQGRSYIIPAAFILIPLLTIVALHAKKLLSKALSTFDIKSINVPQAARTTLVYTLLSLGNASLLWLLIQAIPDLNPSYLSVVSIASIAWLVGFWAIGIPGGIGVREAVLVIALSQYGSMESAILVAILWRGLQMLSEILTLVTSLSLNLMVFAPKKGYVEKVV